jgi:uncharacterized membrane protein YeaQ/YmgE (transglycosylase-associated protein family)
MEIVWLIIAGLVVGALGRLVKPGRDPMGWLVTIAIGIAAVVVVGLLIGGDDGIGFWGYVLAVIVAAVLVAIVGRVWPSDRDRRVAA